MPLRIDGERINPRFEMSRSSSNDQPFKADLGDGERSGQRDRPLTEASNDGSDHRETGSDHEKEDDRRERGAPTVS
jgi:hypothetical protein